MNLERLVMIPLFLILFGVAHADEVRMGSVCVAPVPETPRPGSAPGLFCRSEQLSLKIDQRTLPWPITGSKEISNLDLAARHEVVVFCDAKPQQTVHFRFSELNSTKLCLFLNDLYKTVQLWDVGQAPWCKCGSDGE